MGKHVDTTRPLDDNSRSVNAPTDWVPDPQHRKPGEHIGKVSVMRDAWSGDPDTDRAWR